ncbi:MULTISPECIES: transposase [Streptomyces]|uniref:transposase n=1 Tax=Streptomyces TaxID=1883 RepID=UPI000F437727|nr:transposase [Streptomyces sp. ADI95-16]AYV31994.1 hypothetical protein EES41_35165 [Streptomyces sp. ADI95-16]
MGLADKAHSSRAIRCHLRRGGMRAVIPQPADQTANHKRLGRLGGRPPGFDREGYRQRNTVEQWINKHKQWRGLATRYDKTAPVPSPDSSSPPPSSGQRSDPKETAYLAPTPYRHVEV